MQKLSDNSSYRNLMVALILVLISNPLLLLDGIVGRSLEVIMAITVLNMGMMVRYGKTKQFYLTFAVSLLLIGLWFLSIVYPDQIWFKQVRVLIVIAFLAQITIWLARDVFSSPRVSATNRLYGAICIYLIAGLFFANLYVALNVFIPHSFTCGTELCSEDFNQRFGSGLHLYYSFSTLSTVGYGDISPATPIAAMVSSIEAIMGQMYLAIVVARLVGIHLMDTMAER